ncbi:myosin-binding protein 7-like isoform X1 [Zingiber officinale]|uniref:myosin-binding protein 7-like isoform X1 n=1 Tax=Zingiber officinale TaxID=94328 RepID=UPI001C4D63CA|nr:myosin-binding protein 7-like isoform X1 [Zingiber officinale]
MDFDEFAVAAEGGAGVGGEGLFVRTFSMGLSTSNDPRLSLRRKLRARGADASAGVARVEIRNEAAALRDAILSHHQTIQKLQSELKEERSAAASAAQEAMSMIVRLQHEKAKAILESQQFKRVTEEKMTHDQQEISSLEDLLFKREQAMLALSCEVQAYHHRLLSYGFNIDSDAAPPSEPQTPDSASSGDTPREHLQKLEQRIFQLEQTPSSRFGNVMEKAVMVAHSPQGRSRHLRNISCGSYRSILEFNKADEFQASIDGAPDYDNTNDRVYTVDAVHRASNDYVSTPRELQNRRFQMGGGVEEVEISKLQMRLQVLEADSKSMRHSLTSICMDKMQMVTLKEIARHMCKEGSAEKRIINKPSLKGSSLAITESVVSFFIFWRKKSPQINRYAFGITLGTACLLLLGKPYRIRHRKLLTRTQG